MDSLLSLEKKAQGCDAVVYSGKQRFHWLYREIMNVGSEHTCPIYGYLLEGLDESSVHIFHQIQELQHDPGSDVGPR